ncbi:TonB-dependent receptor [Parapedomonas caeni]
MSLNRLYDSVAFAAIATTLAAPALAQTAPASTPSSDSVAALGEIIVTATRRATNLQDTPVAVSAIDAALIQQASPRDLGDVASFVPNFSASTITGFNAASFAMRGVGQNTIIVYFEPPVAVLVDDFVVPSVQTQLLDTFDIEQVEVLRGPQGTLFGKNTTGGAVTVRTKRPVMNEFGADGRLQLGEFGTWIIQGAVNIPLVQDKAALRIVGGYQKDHGYYRNGGCYGPVTGFVENKWQGAEGCLDGKHVGGKDVWNGRVKLLLEPTDNFSALVQYEKLRDRSESVPSVNENFRYVNAADPFLTDLLGIGRTTDSGDPLDQAMITLRDDALLEMNKGQRIDVDGIYLNMDYDTAVGRLTSVTGWRKQKSRLPNSYAGAVAISEEDGQPLSVFDARRDDDRKTFQQELRFATDTGTAFDAVVGGFYQHDKTSFCVSQILGFLDLTSGPLPFGAWNDTPYLLCNAQKAESKAVFAEGTYKATDKFTITAGARYTWENKTWWGRQQVFIPALEGGFDPTITIDQPLDANVFDYPAGVIKVKDSAKEATWRISLGYQATDDVFGYFTYSRGFKAGGFNDQIGGFAPFGDDLVAFAQAAAATKPETADSFELGVKSELFDRRLRFNLTGFYVKYKDLQRELNVRIEVNDQPNQVTRFVNAASANVKGIELETLARVTEAFTLRGVLGYQDGKYSSYDVEPGLGGEPGSGYDLSTAPLLRTPKWTASADATYELPVGASHTLVFNGNVNYTSANLFSQSITSAAGNAYLNARTLFNASITLSEDSDAYYVRVVGRNLSDKRYRTANQNVGGLWLNSQYGPPRYFGVELGFKIGATR